MTRTEFTDRLDALTARGIAIPAEVSAALASYCSAMQEMFEAEDALDRAENDYDAARASCEHAIAGVEAAHPDDAELWRRSQALGQISFIDEAP